MSAAVSLRVQSGRLPLCVLHSGSFCALPQFQHVVDVPARWGGRTHTAWLPLGDVPLEQWAAVFASLDGPSLGRAAGVCREWRGVADDSGRWLELFAEREEWVRLSCGLGEEAVEEPQACKVRSVV